MPETANADKPEKGLEEHGISAKDYVDLAQIVQTAFDGRRTAEWKIKFGFWSGLGLAFYAVDQRDYMLRDNWVFWTFIAMVALVFVIFIAFELAFQKANMTDKEWKHYYMGRAEGLETTRPEGGPAPESALHTTWFWAYFLFTFVLASALVVYATALTKRDINTVCILVLVVLLVLVSYISGYLRGTSKASKNTVKKNTSDKASAHD